MWWADATRIYVGRGTLLLQRGGAQPQAFALDAGLDLAAVLARLQGHVPAGARIDLHLSSALCPAVDIAYPAGMRRLADMETFAQAVCAARLDAATADVQVRIDPLAPCIAAPLLRRDCESVQAWLAASSLRLRSLQPLWALATGLRLAAGAQAIGLREPDGLTLIGSPGPGMQRGMSMAADPEAPMQALINRLHHALGLAHEGTRLVRFALPGGSIPQDRPGAWTSCWSLA